MGIYDRDYYREQRRPSFSIPAPRTIVVTLILINVAIYLIDVFTPVTAYNAKGDVVARWLSDHMAVQVGSLTKPWMWWQLLTYGFAHSPAFRHVLFNMLTLFFLGRDIEVKYGWKEFLRLYLMMLVVAGLAWAIVKKLQGAPADVGAYGASGAVAGVVVLYAALNFPRRTLLLFFVIPVPAWLVGVLVVVLDMYGATDPESSNIAHTAHLAGAAFAFIYYQLGWNLGRLTQGRFSWPRFKRRPKLRVHDPESRKADLSAEVDRILEKIHRSGEESLTRKERRALENASREYKRRNQG